MLSSTRCLRTVILSRIKISTLLHPNIHTIATNLSNPTVHYDADSVSEALSSYNNDWKKALEFFDWLEKDCNFTHTTETYNRMIDILGKFFEFDLSWSLIRKMQKTNPSSAYPNHTTFCIIFKRYVSAHLVNEAFSAFEKLGEFNLKDETSYCNLVDALCDYKHVIEAEEFYLRDENRFVSANNTKIHNIILRGWFKMGWWGKCREFWGVMDRRGVVKDLVSYSIYMDIQCKSGKPWKAVLLYKEMKRKRMKLDVVAYNTVVQAVGVSEGVDFAIRVFREMRDLGCEPNVVTYNTVVKLLSENGRMKEAYCMLNQMGKKGCAPDVFTYHCFFKCIEKPREMLRLFDRMVLSGLRPRMDTYVMLMRKFGRWGFLRPVLKVWDKMLELGCSPNDFAYNALIDALVQKGMLDEARKYEKEMLTKELSAKPRKELGTMLLDEHLDGEMRKRVTMLNPWEIP